jgi:hypothetical protein
MGPTCKALSQGLEAQRVQREALARGVRTGVESPIGFLCESASTWFFCYSHTRAPNTKTRRVMAKQVQDGVTWACGVINAVRARSAEAAEPSGFGRAGRSSSRPRMAVREAQPRLRSPLLPAALGLGRRRADATRSSGLNATWVVPPGTYALLAEITDSSGSVIKSSRDFRLVASE